MEILLIQFLVFVVYVGYIINQYGILPSISDSWYVLPRQHNFLFTLFTWGIGIPMLFYGNAPLFFAGAGLTFVGAATQFKMKRSYTKQVHFTGAAVGIIIPLLYLAISFGNWIPLAIQAVGTVVITQSKINNKLWWVEILAFICIMFGLYFNLHDIILDI